MQGMYLKRLLVGVACATIVVSSVPCDKNTILAKETDSAPREESFSGGYVISDFDNNIPAIEVPEFQTFDMSSGVPAAYPSEVNQSFINSMPENRNQNPYGTCWAFSTVGLAECDLIHDGAADTSIDLSELALAYFNYHSVEDPLGGTEGDFVKWNDGLSNYLMYGGSYQMSVRRLAQWCGLTSEQNVPYTGAASSVTNGIPSENAYSKNAAYMENAYFTNIRENSQVVKQQVMEHGAVGIMYYHSDSYCAGTSSDVNYVTDNYYVPSRENLAYGGNHAVMIVGWDDNYSKENFALRGGPKPASDGAWLVRNSWGGDRPYFWLSYCDTTIADIAVSFDFTKERPYDNNYQLDGGMNTYRIEYTGAANVFQVKPKTGVGSETLEAVSLSMTQAANVAYTIRVYANVRYAWSPTSGDLVSVTPGSTLNAGVYTIPLDQKVSLKPGETFSVVVTTDKPAIDCEQAIGIVNDNNETIYESKVSGSQTGIYYNSFYEDVNGFNNYIHGNVCIKAFTNNNVDGGVDNPIIPTPEPTPQPEVTPTPAPQPEVTPVPTPTPQPEETPVPTPGPKPANKPVPNGWKYQNGNWYYYRNNNPVTGWVWDGRNWYYMYGNGVMATGWVWDGRNWYYMYGSGAMATGWVWDGCNWYYMYGSGAMAIGWVWDGCNWYYMYGSGAMATGWVWDGRNWYYMNSSGAMMTGWVWDGRNWYFMNSSGAMMTGRIRIGHRWYYFNSGGAWVR